MDFIFDANFGLHVNVEAVNNENYRGKPQLLDFIGKLPKVAKSTVYLQVVKSGLTPTDSTLHPRVKGSFGDSPHELDGVLEVWRSWSRICSD